MRRRHLVVWTGLLHSGAVKIDLRGGHTYREHRVFRPGIRVQ